MDGRTLLRDLRQLLQEQVASTWMDEKTSFDYLYKGAIEFVSRTGILTKTTTITTVSGQSEYVLPADYLNLHLRDASNDYIAKYNDGNVDTFIRLRDYDPVVIANQSTQISVPGSFSIKYYDSTAQYQSLGMTVGYAGPRNDLSGQSALQFAAAAGQVDVSRFSSGDTIYNRTDGSEGIILSIDDPYFHCAMFGGDDNGFEIADSVIAFPQARFSIYLDQPSSTSGHTITIYYVSKPEPVYSYHGHYKIPIDYKQALIYYAAWMYKNRDREQNYAELEMKYFEEQVKKACVQYGKALHRKGFRVNYMKIANPDSSWR